MRAFAHASHSSLSFMESVMERKEKVLVVCKCGRQLEGKFWAAPVLGLRDWIKTLARRSVNRKLTVKVEKCIFCKGLLKECPRPEEGEAW